jgi:hypothetical protein
MSIFGLGGGNLLSMVPGVGQAMSGFGGIQKLLHGDFSGVFDLAKAAGFGAAPWLQFAAPALQAIVSGKNPLDVAKDLLTQHAGDIAKMVPGLGSMLAKAQELGGEAQQLMEPIQQLLNALKQIQGK